MNPQTAELVRRFDALGRFTRLAAVHVPESAELDRARQLVERAMTRLRLGESDEGGHTVVALAGATGVGKSSLFNALARMDISPAGHLRPTTGHAHACVWNPRGADPLLDWLDVAPDRLPVGPLRRRDQHPDPAREPREALVGRLERPD